MSNHENIMNEICAVGKRISITIEITDTVLASKLLGTMYLKAGEENIFGVVVQEWGLWDNARAKELKIQKAIEVLLDDDVQGILRKAGEL